MKISGTVVKGMGTGRYFMSISQYKKQFEKKLGYIPFEGTLNINIAEKDIEKIEKMKKRPAIIINGFEDEQIRFWNVDVYPVKIKESKCAVVFPKNNVHPRNILQIISADYLKKKYGLEEGSEVEIEI
ncbi:MAG: DUF120 domain-containing protein [Candidatus Micrarchaeia archaeon]